jgi:serine/threonine-protein kinase
LSLPPGTRIGPYEVASLLGAGGMGEVYRATDTGLSRQVAIKVLPDAVAEDAERLARFDREARTLAALNHPNIAAIYGIEAGPAEAGHYLRALVMELVEGPTLADRIAQGAVALDEALPIAMQIAKALEAAHEQGIVHRDLKPANIKVRPDGTVKVLDFGLAKALGPEAAVSSSGASLSPTITSPAMMTGAGIILGTAAYMSPEQARGKPVDKRADIWAFGAVVYEMLTGQRAFGGEDVSDTLADVMRVEPAWAKLPDSVPPALTSFLKRCLRKNPSERVRDIGDVRLALEGAFDTIVPTGPAVAAAASPRPLWRRMLPVAGALAAALAAAAGAWYAKPAEPRQVVRLVHLLPESRIFRDGRRNVTISPDGRAIVYNATSGLFLRSTDALNDRLIPGTERVLTNPTFSPDGQSIAFYQDGQIRRIAITGGTSVALVSAGNAAGISWEPDGTILYAQGGGIWQVSENGGDPERVMAPPQKAFLLNPQRLPGSDWILSTLFSEEGPRFDLVAYSPATGERRLLKGGAVGGRYVAGGHIVYYDNGVLYAVRFDADRVAIIGRPSPVVEGVRTALGTPGNAIPQFDVSRNGTLAFIPGPVGTSSVAQFSILVANRAGALTPTRIPPGPYVHVRASRDGSRLAIDTDDGKDASVWIHEMAGTSALRRLTFGGHNRLPVWAPDGQRVAFQSDREGDPGIFMQRADGTGSVERLTMPEKSDVHLPESWSPDGMHLSFSVRKGDAYSLWILSLADRKTTRFGVVQSTEPTGSAFSSDGRWLAYHDGAGTGPSAGVYVRPFPDSNGASYQAPRVLRDFHPAWSRDASELFYVPSVGAGRLASVLVTTTGGLTFGTPDRLPFALTGGQLSAATRAFDVLPGGGFVGPGNVAADAAGAQALAREVRVVVNWFEELKRLVPGD